MTFTTDDIRNGTPAVSNLARIPVRQYRPARWAQEQNEIAAEAKTAPLERPGTTIPPALLLVCVLAGLWVWVDTIRLVWGWL